MTTILSKLHIKLRKQKQQPKRLTTISLPRQVSTLNSELDHYYKRLDANELSGVEMYTLGQLVERYIHECAMLDSREIITYFKGKMYMTTNPTVLQHKLQAVRPFVQ